MKEFYFEDKNKHFSYRGLTPNNDIDWKPIHYAIYPHAFQRAKVYIDMYRHGAYKGLNIDEQFFYDRAYDETISLVKEKISNRNMPTQLADLLKYEALPKRQQEKLLKNLILTADDILCFLFEADIQGWLLDVYYFEKHPERYDEKQKPYCYAEKKDGSIETIGHTDMSDGEMKALLHDRKAIVARVFHKGDHWHCFYHTFRGLAGEEPGENGSKPHWHYLSDKYGIAREKLNEYMKNVDMPSSKVHVFIEREK